MQKRSATVFEKYKSVIISFKLVIHSYFQVFFVKKFHFCFQVLLHFHLYHLRKYTVIFKTHVHNNDFSHTFF